MQPDSPDKSASGEKSPAELALQVYNILIPYDSEVRQRVIQSALTLLGEAALPSVGRPPMPQSAVSGFDDVKLGPKAMRWLQKHGLSRGHLDEIYHLGVGTVDIVTSHVPGDSKREMTINCYLLSGIRGLLEVDTSSLNETETIALCKRLTAYDKNNHTAYRAAVGNRMTGTKPAFILTGPGENAAAELIKQMTLSQGS
jgi:hypothetical protein